MRFLLKSFAAMLISATFVIFSSGVLPAALLNQPDSQTGCSASCHTMSHTVGITNRIRKQYLKKKVVVTTWLRTITNILFTYVLPLATFVWFMNRYKRLLLTARLRF